MVKLSDLVGADEVHEQSLDDPAYQAEWERTALARQVALEVTAYRAEHHLTQTGLGKLLGMSQPQIARLEAGDHEPSMGTLVRLARALDMSFLIDVTPDAPPRLRSTSGRRTTRRRTRATPVPPPAAAAHHRTGSG